MSYYASAAFPKQIRKRDPKLLARIRKQPCLIRSHCRGKVEASHIKSVGARGDDCESNVIPLCRKHHDEWHHGQETMGKKYAVLEARLKATGHL